MNFGTSHNRGYKLVVLLLGLTAMYFIVKTKNHRPTFINDITVDEHSVMEQHWLWLRLIQDCQRRYKAAECYNILLNKP
jgi:hypothetical protein